MLSILVLTFTLVIGPAVLETLRWAGPSQAALGIRTVRDDAGPISFHHAFVRHLIGVIEIWVFSGDQPWCAHW